MIDQDYRFVKEVKGKGVQEGYREGIGGGGWGRGEKEGELEYSFMDRKEVVFRSYYGKYGRQWRWKIFSRLFILYMMSISIFC